MLTAKEARTASESSEVFALKQLTQLELLIRKTCEKGLYACNTEGLAGFFEYADAWTTYKQPTPLIARIIVLLEAEPRYFKAQWKDNGIYKTGGGLGDCSDPEDRPDGKTFSIHISW